MSDHIWDKNLVQNLQRENDELKALLKEVIADIRMFDTIGTGLFYRCEAACQTGENNAR